MSTLAFMDYLSTFQKAEISTLSVKTSTLTFSDTVTPASTFDLYVSSGKLLFDNIILANSSPSSFVDYLSSGVSYLTGSYVSSINFQNQGVTPPETLPLYGNSGKLWFNSTPVMNYSLDSGMGITSDGLGIYPVGVSSFSFHEVFSSPPNVTATAIDPAKMIVVNVSGVTSTDAVFHTYILEAGTPTLTSASFYWTAIGQ